jgi:protein TonB
VDTIPFRVGQPSPIRLLNLPHIVYPPDLKEAGVSGGVVVNLVVDTAGRVEPASVEVTASTNPEFSRAACDALPQSRYAPFAVNGDRRRVQLTGVPLHFSVTREEPPN